MVPKRWTRSVAQCALAGILSCWALAPTAAHAVTAPADQQNIADGPYTSASPPGALAQTIRSGRTGELDGIAVQIVRAFAETGDVTVELRWSGPAGAILESWSLRVEDLEVVGGTETLDSVARPPLIAGMTYAIVVRATGDGVSWNFDVGDYERGRAMASSDGVSFAGAVTRAADFGFAIYVEPGAVQSPRMPGFGEWLERACRSGADWELCDQVD